MDILTGKMIEHLTEAEHERRLAVILRIEAGDSDADIISTLGVLPNQLAILRKEFADVLEEIRIYDELLEIVKLSRTRAQG
jgi:hypothetical protein